MEDLASNGNSIWLNYIKPKIDAVSTGGSLVDPVKGYTTDANTTSANLCRVLFRQMIYSDSSRFNNLKTLDGPGRNTNPNAPNVSNANNPNVANNSNTYYLPFKVGDTISFRAAYNPVSGQQTIVKSTTPVPVRSYRVRIKIVTTPSNVAVTDGSYIDSRIEP